MECSYWKSAVEYVQMKIEHICFRCALAVPWSSTILIRGKTRTSQTNICCVWLCLSLAVLQIHLAWSQSALCTSEASMQFGPSMTYLLNGDLAILYSKVLVGPPCLLIWIEWFLNICQSKHPSSVCRYFSGYGFGHMTANEITYTICRAQPNSIPWDLISCSKKISVHTHLHIPWVVRACDCIHLTTPKFCEVEVTCLFWWKYSNCMSSLKQDCFPGFDTLLKHKQKHISVQKSN